MTKKFRRNQAVSSTYREAISASLASLLASRVRDNELDRFEVLVTLSCAALLDASERPFRKRDIVATLESMEFESKFPSMSGSDRSTLANFINLVPDRTDVVRKLRRKPESTFRTEIISRVINELLSEACSNAGLTWRATASLKRKRNSWTYQLKWQGRIRGAKGEAASLNDANSSHVISMRLGKEFRGIERQVPPLRLESLADAWEASWPAPENLFDTSSSMSGLISGAMFDLSNTRHTRNRQIEQSLRGHDLHRLHMLARDGLNDVVDELIIDLERHNLPKVNAFRFVCTNTTVEQLGSKSWESERALRRLVSETGRLLSAKSGRFTCTRVFIIRQPSKLLKDGAFESFYNTLEENRRIGVEVIIFLAKFLPPICSYRYSDFYCLSRRFAFVSVTPVYLLRKFRVDGPSTDKVVVDHYTHIGDYFIETADNVNDPFAVRWVGGIQQLLRADLEALSEILSRESSPQQFGMNQ